MYEVPYLRGTLLEKYFVPTTTTYRHRGKDPLLSCKVDSKLRYGVDSSHQDQFKDHNAFSYILGNMCQIP